MHSTFRKIIAAVMIMSIGFFAQAQTPGQINPAQSEERQGSPKDEFVKNLKDFQPKLDDLKMKAKDNEEKYPDFSKEVASLDNMVTSFKSKVDEFDATAADQQAKLVSTLRADWSSIQTQYQKATELWSKGHPQNSSDN